MKKLIEIKPLEIQSGRSVFPENESLGEFSLKKQNPYSFVGKAHYDVLGACLKATSSKDSTEKTQKRAASITRELIMSNPKFNRQPGLPHFLDDIIIVCFPTNPFDFDWLGGGYLNRNNKPISIDESALPALSQIMEHSNEILNKINLTDTNHAKEALKAIDSMEEQLLKNGEVGPFDRMVSQIALSVFESSILVWNQYFKDDYDGDAIFERTGGPERIAKADLSGAVAGALGGTMTAPGAGTVVGGAVGGIGSSWGQFFVELF